jgi:hypothetical protein
MSARLWITALAVSALAACRTAPEEPAAPAAAPPRASAPAQPPEDMAADTGMMSQAPEAAPVAAPSAPAPGAQWKQPAVATPAAVPMPAPPGPKLAEGEAGPAPQALGRNEALTARFTAADQTVRYSFEAGERELSLFELAASGYSRGSSSGARIRVTDERGAVLFEEQRAGGTTWHAFWGFAAPAAGSHAVELSAREAPFRFVLVRHSNYARRAPGEVAQFGDALLLHSYLADAADSARFVVSLAAGETVALKVLGTREEARTEARMGARTRPDAAMAQGGRAFQSFQFDVELDGKRVVERAQFALVSAERACEAAIEVQPRYLGDGGLFDLALERSPEQRTVHGLVLDAEDRPLSGVELEFLREPDLDPIGKCASASDGTYRFVVLPGDLTIRMRKGGRGTAQEAHVHVGEDRELNLLVTGR